MSIGLLVTLKVTDNMKRKINTTSIMITEKAVTIITTIPITTSIITGDPGVKAEQVFRQFQAEKEVLLR